MVHILFMPVITGAHILSEHHKEEYTELDKALKILYESIAKLSTRLSIHSLTNEVLKTHFARQSNSETPEQNCMKIEIKIKYHNDIIIS